MKQWLLKSEQTLSTFVTWVSVGLFSGGVLLYTLQVGLRLFFRSTVPWVDPVIGYLFAQGALWGAASACQYNANIKIELFKRIKDTFLMRLIIESVSCGVTLVILYVFYLHFTSVRLAALSPENTSGITWEGWKDIPYIVMFIASLIFYVLRLVHVLHPFRAPPAESTPTP